MEHISEVVHLVFGQGLKVKVSKCEFAKSKVSLLGQVIDKKEIQLDSKKLEVIRSTPRSTNQTELRSLLGIVVSYRRFIPSFASLLALLQAVKLCKMEFLWPSDMDRVFNTLTEVLSLPPVLVFSDFDKLFIVVMDAFAVAIGAVVSQKKGDKRVNPVQFAVQ